MINGIFIFGSLKTVSANQGLKNIKPRLNPNAIGKLIRREVKITFLICGQSLRSKAMAISLRITLSIPNIPRIRTNATRRLLRLIIPKPSGPIVRPKMMLPPKPADKPKTFTITEEKDFFNTSSVWISKDPNILLKVFTNIF